MSFRSEIVTEDAVDVVTQICRSRLSRRTVPLEYALHELSGRVREGSRGARASQSHTHPARATERAECLRRSAAACLAMWPMRPDVARVMWMTSDMMKERK